MLIDRLRKDPEHCEIIIFHFKQKINYSYGILSHWDRYVGDSRLLEHLPYLALFSSIFKLLVFSVGVWNLAHFSEFAERNFVTA